MSKEIKISLFKPSRNGKTGVKPHETDFYAEMVKIQNGTHWTVIKGLREITDPVKKREYKVNKLEGFTIAAVCPNKREIKGAIPSGLMNIDIDAKGNEWVTNWGEIRDMLFEMPDVVASFLSASGKGISLVYKVNTNQRVFKDTFYSISDELEDNFNLKIDPGCHDLARVRFVSHDENLKIRSDFDNIPLKEPSAAYLANKKAKENAVIEYTGEVGTADCDRAWSYAVKSAEQKYGAFVDGSKHHFLITLAGFCNRVGMSKGYCESMVMKTYQSLTDITTDKLLKPIGNVYRTYAHLHNTYVRTVQQRRLNSKITGEVVANYIRKGIKPNTPEVLDAIAQKLEANIESVEAIVERLVDEYKEEYNADVKKENGNFKPFWYVDEDEKVCISKLLFRDYLIGNGVYRLRVEKKWILIKITDSIVEEIQKDQLKELVFSYIEKLKEFEVWEVLANRVSSVFADDYLEIIPQKVIDFYRDPSTEMRIFYENGIVTITSENINFEDWGEFKGYVWKNKVLKRNIDLLPECPLSLIQKFLHNITKKDPKRLESLLTGLAYMIHSYKDKSNPPAVILNDEVISDEPEGGTGKGVLVELLKQFRTVVTIDAKKFDFASDFAYQRVNLDTDIIFFDDCKRNFSFENLFSVLTEGIDVNKKGMQEFKIEFKQAPKIIVSTNYAIVGSGNSHGRRKFELEIAQYYSKKFTPKQEFGKMLFEDFDVQEWNDFDNFIFRACVIYLQKGLVEQELINQPIKQLYAAVSEEFVTFMDEDFGGGSPVRYPQTEMYSAYQKLYPSKLGAKTFYGFVEKYYKYKEIPFERRKSGDTRFFYVNGYQG